MTSATRSSWRTNTSTLNNPRSHRHSMKGAGTLEVTQGARNPQIVTLLLSPESAHDIVALTDFSTTHRWRNIPISLIDPLQPGVLNVMAFHENAGPRQVDFDLPFLKSPFPS